MKLLTKRFFTGAVLFCLIFNSIAAQDTSVQKITIEEAVELALQNNITIKQSKMDLDLLAKKDKYSWNGISPSINLSTGVNGGSRGTLKDFSTTKSDSLSWSASGSLSFTFTPALATSIAAAKLAYESGQLSYESTKRQIELSVRKTFYSLVYFNENLELQERSLETTKQTYEANKTKYEQGRLPELTLLSSQYNYESKIPSVENLKVTYQSNLDNFKLILGLSLSDQIELDGTLLDVNEINLDESILQMNIEDVPAIKAMLMNIASAKNSLTATKYSAWGPRLSLSGNANGSGGIKPSDDSSLNISYSASLTIPLDGYLPWSTGALSIESQTEALEKLELNLEQSKASTEMSIRNSYNQILQAQTQLKLYEKNVELMQKTYDMTKASYNVGSSDLLTLQTAENNLYSAKYNVQNQRYSIISSVLDLENTLGKKIIEGEDK